MVDLRNAQQETWAAGLQPILTPTWRFLLGFSQNQRNSKLQSGVGLLKSMRVGLYLLHSHRHYYIMLIYYHDEH